MSMRSILTSLIVTTLCLCVPAAAASLGAQPATARDQAVALQITGLAEGTAQHLDITPWLDAGAPEQLTISVLDGDVVVPLRLRRHSIRTDDFVCYAVGADGVPVAVDPGPVRTMRGYILGRTHTVVAATLAEDGVHASFRQLDDDGTYRSGDMAFLQPVPGEPGLHVLYRPRNVARTGTASCGMPGVVIEASEGRAPAVGAGSPCITEVAVEAESKFFDAFGGPSPKP